MLCDKANNIAMIFKAKNNSKLFYLLNFSLNHTPDPKIWDPVQVKVLGIQGLHCCYLHHVGDA